MKAARRFASRWRAGRSSVGAAPVRSTRTIEIYDDFFAPETQDEILTRMERPKWSFTGGRPPNQFWHMDGLEEEPFFREHLFGIISRKLSRSFLIERIYANGQTGGQSGALHVDDGDVTFLYYPNPRWKRAWKGSLIFAEESEATDVVEYRPNRGLVFPAHLAHFAEAPSRRFTGLRVSLAYKLRIPR